MSQRLILLGPPGSGKGTQGQLLAERLGIPTISTGALFRDQIARGTALGVEAQTYMAQGHLVPDRVTNAMLRSRLASADAAAGFILDGYPRNLAQVELLDSILDQVGGQIDAAVELRLAEELIVERLLKRASMEGRADDTEPVIRSRLAVYHRETAPIADLYRRRGLLIPIDSVGQVEEVAERLAAALGDRLASGN